MSSGNIIIVIATEKASPSPWSSLYLPSKDQMGHLDQLWDDTFCRWASAPRKGPQVQLLLLLLLAAASAAAATGSVVQVTRSITILRTTSSSPRALVAPPLSLREDSRRPKKASGADKEFFSACLNCYFCTPKFVNTKRPPNSSILLPSRASSLRHAQET